ncbi:hypothetical protein MVEG_06028 [Podila verticillata NRRL 6337]|nr:hypothetical protein MVEG_06028 [Podila verticillata NRRL 6337]
MRMAASDSEATESDGSDTAPLRPHSQLYRERPQYCPTEHHETMEQPDDQREALSMRAVIEEFRKKSMQAVEPLARNTTPPLPPRKAVIPASNTCTSYSDLVSNTRSRQQTSHVVEIHDDSTDTDDDRRLNEMELIRQRRLASTRRSRCHSLKNGIERERRQTLTRSQKERRSQPRELAASTVADELSFLSRRILTDMDMTSAATPKSSKRPYPSSCSDAGDETESDTETTRLLRRLYLRINYIENERAEFLEREQGYQTQILNLAARVTQLEVQLDNARKTIMGQGPNHIPFGDRPSALSEVAYTTASNQAHSPRTSLCLPVLGRFGK